MQNKPDIFISHSSADTEFVTQLAEDLQKEGLHAKTYKHIIHSESELNESFLDERIANAIHTFKYFVVVLTKQSIKSKWVQSELKLALENESKQRSVRVLPVLAQNCLLPDLVWFHTPVDFTKSYEKGLYDFITKISSLENEAKHYTYFEYKKSASEELASNLYDFIHSRIDTLAKLNTKSLKWKISKILQDDFGCEIQLANLFKDGGIDCIAYGGKDANEKPIFIQCKRYKPSKRLSLEFIYSLVHANFQELASPTLLCTSVLSQRSDDEKGKFLRHLTTSL